jgi:hypothetical protein
MSTPTTTPANAGSTPAAAMSAHNTTPPARYGQATRPSASGHREQDDDEHGSDQWPDIQLARVERGQNHHGADIVGHGQGQ